MVRIFIASYCDYSAVTGQASLKSTLASRMPQEMLADKLKLLNYEADFCRKK